MRDSVKSFNAWQRQFHSNNLVHSFSIHNFLFPSFTYSNSATSDLVDSIQGCFFAICNVITIIIWDRCTMTLIFKIKMSSV